MQLTAAQLRALRKKARETRVSLASLIREALDASLQTTSPVPDDAERWRRSLATVGKFAAARSGNASEDHDEHLAEAYQR